MADQVQGSPNLGRLICGVILVAVGLVFLLDELFRLDVGAIWDFWPLILVAIGVGKLASPARGRRGFGGLFLVVLGLWLLSDQLGWIAADDSWPVLLMAIGAVIMLSAFRHRREPRAAE